MLKQDDTVFAVAVVTQPPSGGCVLKRHKIGREMPTVLPAAFGRLCVETGKRKGIMNQKQTQPPSGGCVLKPVEVDIELMPEIPAAFGRLCVETNRGSGQSAGGGASRLRAAVC